MNSLLFSNIIRFIALVLLQVLICNQMNFLGSINPYIYILFILIYPVKNNRLSFILISFVLGILIDIFIDTGGAHAAASVTIAYMRPVFLKFSFGAAYEYQAIKFNDADLLPRVIYFTLLILIHHFILFILIIFDNSKAGMVVSNALSTGLFTLFLALTLTALFSRKEK
ncbi:rod shape-determining protein MreD [Flavobacteriaceae bacterium]|uniref:rod shape-determining protein MreD n=1 Tax=Formosa sp. Hel3_A1_48 TaxID=1336795 RepID=UPI00084E14DF|nr:rod shape-determining protein MreD [Formosa sp. Hel3_A1_48]MDC0950578.1 rod shape-determining protein MreD [Flavobacteriaceae bacterium]